MLIKKKKPEIFKWASKANKCDYSLKYLKCLMNATCTWQRSWWGSDNDNDLSNGSERSKLVQYSL